MSNIDMLLAGAAHACARGVNQESLVNELLTFKSVPMTMVYMGHMSWVTYGITGLKHESFRNLKRRLVQAGFVIKWDKNSHGDCVGVTMMHPLAEKSRIA